MEFSRQEYSSGLLLLSPGDLPNPGIKPGFPTLQQILYHLSHQGSLNISPSNEQSRLISFSIDWFGLLAIQGNLKSLLQHHSSKTSILQCAAFFMVQLAHPYMTTGKIIALIMWTIASKVMSLLLNTLSRLSWISFQGASIF